MNLQDKIIESTADLRARATALTQVAVEVARTRAELAAKRARSLKGSFETLTVAGRALNEVAQRHASRFVKENSTLALDVGKDVSAIARSAYTTLVGAKPVAKARAVTKTRKPRAVTRKRAAKTA